MMSNSRARPLIRFALTGAVASLLAVASGGRLVAESAGAGHAASPAGLPGNAGNGAKLYQACMGCHAIDENDVGPKHRGVVGRRAGAVPGYVYSPAVRASGLVWTPANLDRWLTNPQALVPGAKMYFAVAKAQDRADIIAFLAHQK